MGGSYMVEGGVIHAKTMLAYHRDGRNVSRTMAIAFTAVLALTLWLWADTGHAAFAFSASVSALLILVGIRLYIHHGQKVLRWTETLDRWENLRRDRMIHARHLKDFEL